jgi:hypothetical protein
VCLQEFHLSQEQLSNTVMNEKVKIVVFICTVNQCHHTQPQVSEVLFTSKLHCDSSQVKPGPEMPKDSNTAQSNPQTMAVKSKLEGLLRSQCHANSGENSAATRHVIVHEESGLKLIPMEKLLQERRTEGDSQLEGSDQVSKLAYYISDCLSLYVHNVIIYTAYSEYIL